MKIYFYLKKCAFILCTSTVMNLAIAGETPRNATELRENGAFGFPQKSATVFCDNPTLRFSVWGNDKYLFAQAVLWTDDDASLGKTEDNREIGDWSVLMLDVDADGKPTKDVDRNYLLNPWPGMEGMYYQVMVGQFGTTSIKSDSEGRGAIRYLKTTDGKQIRVDSYLIPLAEISRRGGDKIRLAYWGQSPNPPLTVNSAGYERPGKSYYSHNIPWSLYHDYVLTNGGHFDETVAPDGRHDITLSTRKNVPMPKVGEMAPEISAKDWINLKSPPTLLSLRGKTTVVKFWATWCGPCVEGIPHLNELQRKYAGKNFQLLTLVEEGLQTMGPFLTKKQVEFPIGLESSSLDDYGVTGIPQAFVIDKSGKIVWEGNSASPGMNASIEGALAR